MWLEPCFIKEELLTLVIQDVKKTVNKGAVGRGKMGGQKTVKHFPHQHCF